MEPREYTHGHAQVHMDTHVITLTYTLQHTTWVGSGACTCPSGRHAQVHVHTGMPMWDGMRT